MLHQMELRDLNLKLIKIKVNIKTLLENNEKYSSINNYNKLICLFSE